MTEPDEDETGEPGESGDAELVRERRGAILVARLNRPAARNACPAGAEQ